MSDKIVVRIIRDILVSGDLEASISCEEIRPLLGDYVEAELAGQPVATLFPHVAKHLHECPDCLDLYAMLRLSFADTEPIPAEITPLDPQRFPPPFAIKPPPSPPESPLAWALRRLGEWLDGWQIYQPQLVGATRSAHGSPVASSSKQPVFERSLSSTLTNTEAKAVVRAKVKNQRASVQLRIEPDTIRPADGLTILYRIVTSDPPNIELITMQPMSASGRWVFDDLPLDDYMLTLKRPDHDEIELVWLGREFWRDL